MPNIALSEARVKALKPRGSTYDIRDGKLRGFGVRVMPSGAKRFFIHIQHQGERQWKILGGAKLMHVNKARARAASAAHPCRPAGQRNGVMRPSSSPNHSTRLSAVAGGNGSMPTSRSIVSIVSQSSIVVR